MEYFKEDDTDEAYYGFPFFFLGIEVKHKAVIRIRDIGKIVIFCLETWGWLVPALFGLLRSDNFRSS